MKKTDLAIKTCVYFIIGALFITLASRHSFYVYVGMIIGIESPALISKFFDFVFPKKKKRSAES